MTENRFQPYVFGPILVLNRTQNEKGMGIKMKISYNEATARDCSTLEKDLQLCEEMGFDYIEMRFDMLHSYLKTHTVQDLKSFFTNHHLKPHALNALYTYPELFSSEDDVKSQKTFMQDFLFACQIGQELELGYIIVVPPLMSDRISPFSQKWEKVKEDCVRIFKKMANMAQDYRMNLCIELVGAAYSSVRSIEQVKEIVEQVDYENVGYVFDSFNIYSNGRLNDFSLIKTVEPQKIFAIHINNCDDVLDSEMGQDKRCFCDTGVIDLCNYLTVLKEMGYQGIVSIETFRPEYWAQTSEQVIKEAYRTTYYVLKANQCL